MKLDNIFAGYFSSFGSIATITLTALLLIYYVLTYISKPSNSKLPAGPRGLPLLGNVLQMVKDPHLKFSKWAQEFGKWYTVHLTTRPAVMVNDVALLKEVFGTMASTGKFLTDTLLLVSRGPNGILNSVGAVWAEQRQFCIRNLRLLGFGQSSSMEPLILQECHELCEWIRITSSNDSRGHVDLKAVVDHASVNALWSLVAGKRLSFDDNQLIRLLHTIFDAVNHSVKTGLIFMPWLKYVAPNLSGYEYLDNASKDMYDYIAEEFEEHKETYVKGQIRDLIDAYIEQMNDTNENEGNGESSFFGEKGFVNSVSSIVTLFMAGGDTVANTIMWAALYLSHEQEVQRKLQNEIDEVVGRDRDPSLVDRSRMPYTDAVIMETLRLSSLIIFGTPRELLEDVHSHGYILPKGTIVFGNLYHINHDPVVWGDPDNFRPERFLMDEGLKECMVPFHVGKRQCLGQELGKDVLFMFFVKIFQQFNIRPVSGASKEEDFIGDVGLLLLPKRSEFVIESR